MSAGLTNKGAEAGSMNSNRSRMQDQSPRVNKFPNDLDSSRIGAMDFAGVPEDKKRETFSVQHHLNEPKDNFSSSAEKDRLGLIQDLKYVPERALTGLENVIQTVSQLQLDSTSNL